MWPPRVAPPEGDKEGRSREHAGWPAGGLWGQPEEAVFKRTEGKEKDIPRPWVGMA